MAIERHSVYADSYRESDCFKWIESEKAGRDLGETAIEILEILDINSRRLAHHFDEFPCCALPD